MGTATRYGQALAWATKWLDRIRAQALRSWHTFMPRAPMRWTVSIQLDPRSPCKAEVVGPAGNGIRQLTATDGLLTFKVERHGITRITLQAEGYHPAYLRLDARNASTPHVPICAPGEMATLVSLTPLNIAPDPVGWMVHWAATGAVMSISEGPPFAQDHPAPLLMTTVHANNRRVAFDLDLHDNSDA